jgi:hypothetical protein
MAMRAIVQSHRTVAISRAVTKSTPAEKPGTEKRFSENLGITGLLVPLYAMGLGTGTLPWVLLFYAAFYGLGSLFVITKLVLSTSHDKETKE